MIKVFPKQKEGGKFKIEKWAIITLVIVLELSIYIVLLPEQATSTLNNLRVFTTSKMGFYFVLIIVGIFAVNISLAFSKYRNIKLGKGDLNSAKAQCSRKQTHTLPNPNDRTLTRTPKNVRTYINRL